VGSPQPRIRIQVFALSVLTTMSFFSILMRRWFWFALLPTLVASGQMHPAAESTQSDLPVIGAAPPAGMIPPSPTWRYPNGETYVYGVEWHMFNAGVSKVTIQSDANQEHVSGVADSSGFVGSLYKVHDRFDAFFDPHTLCSSRVSKHTEEGAHERDTQINFNYAQHQSVMEEKNLKTGELKRAESDIGPCVTDVVSGFYYLASLPLQPGSTYNFEVSDGKTSKVKAYVEGREEVKVPTGKFETLRVKVEATSGSLQGKGTVWAWFTDDAGHIPVQMKSKMTFGTLMFKMQRIDKQ